MRLMSPGVTAAALIVAAALSAGCSLLATEGAPSDLALCEPMLILEVASGHAHRAVNGAAGDDAMVASASVASARANDAHSLLVAAPAAVKRTPAWQALLEAQLRVGQSGNALLPEFDHGVVASRAELIQANAALAEARQLLPACPKPRHGRLGPLEPLDVDGLEATNPPGNFDHVCPNEEPCAPEAPTTTVRVSDGTSRPSASQPTAAPVLPLPVADAASAAQSHLRATTGATCTTSQYSSWPAEELDFTDEVEAVAGRDVWVRRERAWLGSLTRAAEAFGGQVVSRDSGSAWIVRGVRADDAFPDAPVGSAMVEQLLALETGRGTVWFRSMDSHYVVSCG